MEPAAAPRAVDASAPAIRDGVVARPGLARRLTDGQRVVQVSAPPGSGKSVLLRSWIAESGLDKQVARVTVPPGCDAQRFWISVAGALRDTSTGSALVRALTAAPDLDGWTVVERLLEDLAFEAPDMHTGRVEITAAYVKERLTEVAADEDLSRYIL